MPKSICCLEGLVSRIPIALSIGQQETICNYPSDARSLTHSINESINQSCYDVNSYLATAEGSIEKKKTHSELYVEDSGNIRNIHAMPNFKVKGIMYDETNM